ncbi:Fic family protein [uncultured Tateyamaria sp.]|uniref:Fic family protein n=1 Tax=uncultured Tateyamaria sp. TaxID=455651 RepID=UPI00263584D3|nr:Fic family protein [uncultured Tateyamaria sp.]
MTMATDTEIFDKLGFSWDRDVLPAGSATTTERSLYRYKQMMAQFVFDASSLEGNPFTFPEVKTLLDGVTVGGRKVSDQQQVLNLAAAATELFDMVKKGTFKLDKATSDRLHALVAREEAFEWGHFRGEGEEAQITPRVALGELDSHYPPETEPGGQNLVDLFNNGVAVLNADVPHPQERAMAHFLFGALQQFYFDGNKRTARFMMNGVLMSEGMDAISVPATRAQEFNEKMVRFYVDKDATEMMAFLLDCRPSNAPRPRPTVGAGGT